MHYNSARILENPLACRSIVVKGFGRGGKELGCPTANLDTDKLDTSVLSLEAGIYYGWASVGKDPSVYMMVMSIGWFVS